MKVTTSCLGRFHIFDQARELERLGVLHRIVCGFPKYMTRQWHIPDSRVTSLLAHGVLAKLASAAGRKLPRRIESHLARLVHDGYSRRLPRHIPDNSNVFIGLSSFSLEGLIWAKQKGILAVVDHGSLHEREAGHLQLLEMERWGLRSEIRWPLAWVVEKEDREFREANCVLVLSRRAKRSLVEQGIPEDKVFVNNCGVDLAGFRPGRKADGTFRIIQCGGIVPCKGVQYLLKAFSELKLPKAELWFIGGGLGDSPLKPVIERYASDDIIFKGAFPQAQLQPLYAQGSVFVLASVADGFGMVVPQAMACGLPVIVTENTGAADVVTNGKNGFIVPARDVQALKDKLLFLYESPDIRAEMAREALKTSQRDLSWQAYGQRLVWELERRLHEHHASALKARGQCGSS